MVEEDQPAAASPLMQPCDFLELPVELHALWLEHFVSEARDALVVAEVSEWLVDAVATCERLWGASEDPKFQPCRVNGEIRNVGSSLYSILDRVPLVAEHHIGHDCLRIAIEIISARLSVDCDTQVTVISQLLPFLDDLMHAGARRLFVSTFEFSIQLCSSLRRFNELRELTIDSFTLECQNQCFESIVRLPKLESLTLDVPYNVLRRWLLTFSDATSPLATLRLALEATNSDYRDQWASDVFSAITAFPLLKTLFVSSARQMEKLELRSAAHVAPLFQLVQLNSLHLENIIVHSEPALHLSLHPSVSDVTFTFDSTHCSPEALPALINVRTLMIDTGLSPNGSGDRQIKSIASALCEMQWLTELEVPLCVAAAAIEGLHALSKVIHLSLYQCEPPDDVTDDRIAEVAAAVASGMRNLRTLALIDVPLSNEAVTALGPILPQLEALKIESVRGTAFVLPAPPLRWRMLEKSCALSCLSVVLPDLTAADVRDILSCVAALEHLSLHASFGGPSFVDESTKLIKRKGTLRSCVVSTDAIENEGSGSVLAY